MEKSKIFFLSLIVFILGIGTRSFFEISHAFILLGLVLAISLISVFWKNNSAAYAAFLIICAVAGILKVENRLEWVNKNSFEQKKIHEYVAVVKEPERKGDYQELIVAIGNDKAIINAPSFPGYSYGDELSVECYLKIPENRDNDFDYKMYLAKDGIRYICDHAIVGKISSGKGSKPYAMILKAKNILVGNVTASIPQPEGALASGVLFGGSDGMSKKVQEDFSRTGMTHIVAVSGYNVTIIAEYLVLLGISMGLWRRQALLFAIAGIFLFVAMIGFPSSAVRAGVMGGVLIWAMRNGRLADSTNAIIFAGAVMLFINPLLLRWDVGFQLSFLAALGIVQLSPLLEKMQIKKKDPIGLLEIILLTISAQIFVLPVIISSFGKISLISIFANVLILPIVPISMLFSFLASVAGVVVAPAANIFAWLAYLPLKYETGVIGYLSSVSWASISGIEMGAYKLMVYYILLTAVLIFAKKKYYAF